MPITKYIIEITETDRTCLTDIGKKGNSPARTILRQYTSRLRQRK